MLEQLHVAKCYSKIMGEWRSPTHHLKSSEELRSKVDCLCDQDYLLINIHFSTICSNSKPLSMLKSETNGFDFHRLCVKNREIKPYTESRDVHGGAAAADVQPRWTSPPCPHTHLYVNMSYFQLALFYLIQNLE